MQNYYENLRDVFLAQQREQENSQQTNAGGWNEKKKLWFPYESPEGGTKTVGYGTKLTVADGNKYAQGITDEQAKQLQYAEFCSSQQILRAVLKKKNIDLDKCDRAGILIALDLIYNVGQGGFLKFEKFMKALGENNKEAMINESKTHYTDAKGVRHEMKRRNKFREQFLKQYWIKPQPKPQK